MNIYFYQLWNEQTNANYTIQLLSFRSADHCFDFFDFKFFLDVFQLQDIESISRKAFVDNPSAEWAIFPY